MDSFIGPLISILNENVFRSQLWCSSEWYQMYVTVMNGLPWSAQPKYFKCHPSFGATPMHDSSSLSSLPSCISCRCVDIQRQKFKKRRKDNNMCWGTKLTLECQHFCLIFAGIDIKAFFVDNTKGAELTLPITNNDSTSSSLPMPILPLPMVLWPLIIHYLWTSFNVRIRIGIRR
jgi:hypothetical protein